MARIRSIKPSFWEDELVGAMPAMTRLTFVGLFSLADDEGRMRSAPAFVRSQLFMYDDATTTADVEAALLALHNAGRIRLYGNGQRYLEVVNFAKHQYIQRPQPSQLPAPGGAYRVLPTEGGSEQDIPIPLREPSDTAPIRKRKGKGMEVEVSGSVPSEPSPSSPAKPSTGPSPEKIRKVFEAWRQLFDRNANTKLDDKRRRRIRWALKTYGDRDVWSCLQGYAGDPWRHEAASRNEIATLFRDAGSVEAGIEKLRVQRGEVAPGGGVVADELEKAGY